MNFEALKPKLKSIISQENLDINHRLTEVCDLLQTQVDTYDWVGFYFKNGDKRELILKAFAGEPTDHTVIPFGKGICGQVAESNQNFVVDDVSAQDNYIACSINVKSEVVIPLFLNGENIGQIDIDSNTKKAFSKEDEDFLAWVNTQVSQQLEA
ncbi:GAF domain-containing protein [Psychroflexus sp. CAK57W]|uniref:GAF domain-containing protein n=1 Tax=Psychroflexus curvus TaxID=2873595 RepID=UPI001CCC16BA|nr:GAF domain-containing protein [Psychroflexus curvus]MBZ9628750.1 GAF domain-containing protein [Psychroflexus curvus]MBZ9786834.1 GAF domain-containing protein [Psychroflexus curvus]